MKKVKVTEIWQTVEFECGNTILVLEVDKNEGYWNMAVGEKAIDIFDNIDEETAREILALLEAAIDYRFKEKK